MNQNLMAIGRTLKQAMRAIDTSRMITPADKIVRVSGGTLLLTKDDPYAVTGGTR